MRSTIHRPLALLIFSVVTASGPVALGQPYQWINYAGRPGGSGNTDGVGNQARFNGIYGTAVDSSGNIYVADYNSHTIRKMTPDGEVTTLAGKAGQSGSTDGQGADARFHSPKGVAVDGNGNVFVADQGNNTIRRITDSGLVSTVAGSPEVSGSTDGAEIDARFNSPMNVAVDADGSVFVADGLNHTIRKISSSGIVSTLAGMPGQSGKIDGTGSDARFNCPDSLCFDRSGDLWVGDEDSLSIRRVTMTGVVTTLVVDGAIAKSARTGFRIAVDSDGIIYVADPGDYVVRKITNHGNISILAGGLNEPGCIDGPGNTARFNGPNSVTADANGDILVSDRSILRKVTRNGEVSTLAGQTSHYGSIDGTGIAARFQQPRGVGVDGEGNVFVTDYNNHTIRKITHNGIVSTWAGSPGISGSSDGTGSDAQFGTPAGIAVDGSGNLFVSDSRNNTIRKISSSGLVTTLAGSSGQQGRTDGTGSIARFRYPMGAGVDGSGNIFVADTSNHSIRKITSAAIVSTLAGGTPYSGSADGTGIAASFYSPQGVAVDGSGNVIVADTGNHTIRKVTSDGVVTTLAGSPGQVGSADGTGSEARFSNPSAVAVDTSGNIFVADSGNHTIRMIDSTGEVSTIGGTNGVIGGANGIGPAAEFSSPTGITVSASGELFVADSSNNRIVRGSTLVMNSLEIWRQQFFGIHENVGDAADDGDFDHDGLPNLLEWSCGLDPTHGNASPLSTGIAAEGMKIRYGRSVDAVIAGAQITLEWSDTLTGSPDWSTVGISETILSNDGARQQVEATIPFGGTRRFARLKTKNPQP